jgi:hypothetical protein
MDLAASAALLCVMLAGCEQPQSERARTTPSAAAERATPAAAPSLRPPPSSGAGVQRARYTVTATTQGDEQEESALKTVLDSSTLRDFADQLSDLVAMRQAVLVDVRACGKPDASYDRASYRITICEELFRSLGATLTFLHEAGHALVQQLALPIEGSEEDAADQFAAYILGGNPDADQTAMNGAAWFPAMFDAPHAPAPSWDDHALDAQRFARLNCWVLGSNPDGYAWLVDPRIVPADRAARCPSEWTRLERSFSTLLAPHLR